MNRGKPFTQHIDQLQPDIAILTAGAHIANATGFDRMLDTVSRDIIALRKSHPNLRVLWKTQQPGGCGDSPLDRLPDTEYWDDQSGQNSYNYRYFLEWDALSRARFQTLDVPVIDLQMLYYRVDAHRRPNDCLHMCMPGPLDAMFPTMLQHTFREHSI